MTEVRAMIALANDYLTERRQLGLTSRYRVARSRHSPDLPMSPLLLGTAAGNPSSIRRISGGEGPGHRVSVTHGYSAVGYL
jgi:hypothetical protein